MPDLLLTQADIDGEGSDSSTNSHDSWQLSETNSPALRTGFPQTPRRGIRSFALSPAMPAPDAAELMLMDLFSEIGDHPAMQRYSSYEGSPSFVSWRTLKYDLKKAIVEEIRTVINEDWLDVVTRVTIMTAFDDRSPELLVAVTLGYQEARPFRYPLFIGHLDPPLDDAEAQHLNDYLNEPCSEIEEDIYEDVT